MEVNDKRHKYDAGNVFADDSFKLDPPDTSQSRTLALVEDLRAEIRTLKGQNDRLQSENNLLTTAIDLCLEMEGKLHIDQCTPAQKSWFLAGWHKAFDGIHKVNDALIKVRGMSQHEIDTNLELRDNAQAVQTKSIVSTSPK